MKKKPNYHKEILSILEELTKSFPNYNIGRHLSTALDGYGDAWAITDKELLFAFMKYKGELELDIPHNADELDQIIKGGMDLDNLFKEEEDNGYNY